ncbi:MAG: S-layer protein [Candidatus Aenigmatarchaeota archaeon]
MKEKLIAGLMAALTALTTVYPVLAVTLGDAIPSLGTPVEDWLIVIGATAKPEDVVGAADIAITLAGLSTEEVTLPGAAAAVTGKEVSVAFDADLTTQFGTDPLTQTQVPLLRRETITYEDQSSWLVEEITIPNAVVKHDAELNGTVYVDLSSATTLLTYKVKFTTPIKLAGSYDKLFKVKLFGQEFSIVNVTDDDKIKVLTGVTGSIDGKTGLTYGEYTFYAEMGGTDWAKINIMKGDSRVDTVWPRKGSTAATSSVTGLEVMLLDVIATSDNVVVKADIVVGPKGKTLKEYGDGDAFPLNDYWTFDIEATKSTQNLDYIALTYSLINETNKYLKAGEKVIVPNDYFDLGFHELAVKDFVKLTITPGKTYGGIYNIANPDTKLEAELPAIVITADKPVFYGEQYSKAYIAYNYTSGSEHLRLAYYDDSLGKIVSGSAWTNTSLDNGIALSGKYDKHTFNILYNNATSASLPPTVATLTIDTQDTDLIKSLFTYDATAKKFILGYKESEAEGVDVIVGTSEKGAQEWKETLDYGTVIEGIKSNSVTNKVVISLPADQQKAKVYVGKLGAAVEGQTYKKYVSVTMPIARLDTELTATDKTKNLVVVGGPCVNKEAAAALGLTFPACGAASTIPENAAIIKVVEDYPAKGKFTIVVAGWEAANTRTACSVVQQYDTLLKDQTAKAVKVTAATTAGITPI